LFDFDVLGFILMPTLNEQLEHVKQIIQKIQNCFSLAQTKTPERLPLPFP